MLNERGYKIEGNSDIFTITRTNSKYDSKEYNSVLTYDVKHDLIQEESNAKDLTAKTVFVNNSEIRVSILNNETGDVYANPDSNGKINSLTLAFLNVITFGAVTRRLNAINQLSNIWK